VYGNKGFLDIVTIFRGRYFYVMVLRQYYYKRNTEEIQGIFPGE